MKRDAVFTVNIHLAAQFYVHLMKIWT